MEETITYKGYEAYIRQDAWNNDSPRKWENLGTCVFAGKYSHLGDRTDIDNDTQIRKEYGKDAIILPVYGYSHSGLTIATTPFSCPWDSGRLGSIVVSREKVRKWYMVKRIDAKLLAKVKKALQSEIKILDMFITGDVWRVQIKDIDGNTVDDRGAVYGYDASKQEAKDIIDWDIRQKNFKLGVQQELAFV